MHYSSYIFTSLMLGQGSLAGVLKARQDTTSSATSTTATSTGAAAGLIQTTISGQATTLQVAVPTGDATATQSTAAATEVSTSTGFNPLPTEISLGSASMLACSAPEGNPICFPANETLMNTGDTYFVTWDPTRFEANTTISILLNYANDTSNGNRVAWTSPGTPREKGFVTIRMEDSWRMDTRNATLEFVLTAYAPNSQKTASSVDGPTIYLAKASSHYPPPPENKLPDKLSLMIGLPLGLGCLFFVLIGLYFGMRKQRKIDVRAIVEKMGRKRGYVGRKSKRQRLGLKKGAIRLEERELHDPARDYRDADEIHAAPRDDYGYAGQDQEYARPPAIPRRGTDESLGSLVSDRGQGGNAFRNEMDKQRTGRENRF